MPSGHRLPRRPVTRRPDRPPPGGPARLHRTWSIPVTISALWALICRIDDCLQPFAPSRAAKEDVILALVEALSNAYSGSRQAAVGQRIVVGLRVSTRAVRLEIRDAGMGFAFRERPLALAPAEDEAGRGLFLIGRVMERVSWSNTGRAILMSRPWRRGPLGASMAADLASEPG